MRPSLPRAPSGTAAGAKRAELRVLTPLASTASARSVPEPGRVHPRRVAELAAVGSLLLLAVALRVRGLPGGGPVAYDEGWAAANGRFLIALITHPARWGGALHQRLRVFPYGYDGKVGHDLMLGTVQAVGVSPSNLTWYSALAGIVMVIALAALAWRRWGAPAAAVSGVFAGTIPLGIVYGHRIVAEADGLAAVALALFLLDRWWDARPSKLLTIVTLGAFLAALSLSYRFLPTLLPILLVLGWLGWWYAGHRMPPTAPVGRLVTLCLVPALALVSLYLLIPAGTGLGLHPPAALQRWFIHASAGAPLPFAFPDFYFRTFWDFGGPAILVAAGLGTMAAAWSWKRLEPLAALALGSLWGTLLFFTAVHDKAPRAIVIAIPFAGLLVARAVTLWTARSRQWAVGLAVCAACLYTGWAGSSAAREVSGTGQAGRWLAAHPGAIVATRTPVLALYIRPQWDAPQGLDRAHQFVRSRQDSTIGSLRQEGARWVVVDAHALLLGASPVFTQLLACGRPAVEFRDAAGWSRLQFLEEADTLHLDYDAVLAVRAHLLATAQGVETLRIYDLEGTGTAGCQ
ncbi:MAG TPA: hypothetical protein VET82_05640 [Candidatus Eisenbacteria bacterium]|nr:hypothetical protein [Candidatus Eisenbacteria bacterium]